MNIANRVLKVLEKVVVVYIYVKERICIGDYNYGVNDYIVQGV